MTDFPGTQPGWVRLQDGIPPEGDPYEANQVNTIYDEVEAIAAHLGAGTSIASGGGIRLVLKDGATVVGYCGHKGENDVADVAQTVIPGGADSVTAVLLFAGVVKASDGQVQWGVSGVKPGEAVSIFDDGAGNVLELACSAEGEVTVQRTAGGLTYDVVLNLLAWI